MLPQLRSLFERTVQGRRRVLPPPGADARFASSFLDEDKLSVEEVSYTEFARAVEAEELRTSAR